MDKGTGAGVYTDFLGTKKSYKLINSCNVFQAENFDIYHTLNYISLHISTQSKPITASGSRMQKNSYICRLPLWDLYKKINTLHTDLAN